MKKAKIEDYFKNKTNFDNLQRNIHLKKRNLILKNYID